MIKVIGDKAVAGDLRRASSAYDIQADRTLRKAGQFTVGRARAYTLDAGSVDLGELVQGIHAEHRHGVGYREVRVRPSDAADRYAVFVERGTRPHTPPAAALQGWADRHGIPVWAVVRKIAREGTDPRHMWRDTFSDLQERAANYATELLNNITRSV
jgi:hypothetical protein